MSRLGVIRAIHRFPVKSMKGERLAEARISASGVLGDRAYALVDPEKSANFPWLSARQVAEMILFEPRYESPPPVDQPYPDLKHFRVIVRTPEGDEHAIDDPAFHALLEKRWGKKFTLRFSDRGHPDAAPVSILSPASVASLSAETGLTLDPLRFRPNLLVEWDDPTAFFEDSLVGKHIQVGDKVELAIASRNTRCTVITLDPRDATPSPQVLKTVGVSRKGCVGVYGAVIRPGVIREGDPVTSL